MDKLLCWTLIMGATAALAHGFRVVNNEISLSEDVESFTEESSREESWNEEISAEDENIQAWFKCPPQEDGGLYPNPRNCSSFVQCSNGRPQVMPCPDSLHYSAETKQCERPCDAYCNRTISCDCKWPTCGLPRACFLSKDSGPCRASFPRFFFNKRSGKCEKFIYGGCKGNANNFKTKEACEQRCTKVNYESSTEDSSLEESWNEEISAEDENIQAWFKCPSQEDGGLYPNPRNCSSFVQCSNGRPQVMPCPEGLHYSTETKQCERPCDAYCNRTISCDCKWPTCGLPRVCFLSKDSGPCFASFPRFFFNKRSGKCEKFIYGGCKGNSNNFKTKEACEQRCTEGDVDDEISPADEQFESRYRCPPQEEGDLFPNPRNCSTFVQCSNGKPYVMPCPKGLHFSQKTKQCEQPCDAYCNRKLSCECKWPTCGLPSLCFKPKKSGPCHADFHRWFFNRESGSCERFIFGGCKGNSNSFHTKEECQKMCRKIEHDSSIEESSREEESWNEEISLENKDVATWFKCPSTEDGGLYPNPRNCSSFVQCSNGRPQVMPCPEGLHYSTETKQCERPCDAYCNRTLSCKCKWPTCDLLPVCFLPKDSGPCSASFRSFFFNKRSGKCEKFLYGGCQGNANNFKTKEACEQRCTKGGTDDDNIPRFRCPPHEDGGLFPNPHNCSTFVQCTNGRPLVMPCPEGLHYSTETKRCERPCDAYCNRTLSCKCKWPTCDLPSVCFLPKDSGPCSASFRYFFFNKRSGKCEKFIYGGCQGNANNFKTKEACEQRCTKELPQVCQMPKVVGPCEASFPRFFFNERSGQCEKFIYGGCKGNANNFDTKEACEQKCTKGEMSHLDETQ